MAAAAQDESQTPSPVGGAPYPNVDSWIAIDRTGRVTVSWGKVEQGTGIATAIAQLVAEDLDVPFTSIDVLQGDTDRTPNQGYTRRKPGHSVVGSTPVRQAAAQARLALIAIAAQKLGGCSGTTRETRAGAVVSTTDASVHLSYAELVPDGRIDQAIAPNVVLKAPSTYQVIGKPIARVGHPLR